MAHYYVADELTGAVPATDQAGTGIIVTRRNRVDPHSSSELMVVQGTLTLASGVTITQNDVFEMCVLPADCIPVDWVLGSDQLDSSTGLTVTPGVMTGAVGDTSRDNTNFPAANAAGSGGAGITFGRTANDNFLRNATSWFARAAVSAAPRSVGFFAAAAATTNPSATRKVWMQLFYRSARYGA